MTTTIRAATPFHWFGNTYAADDAIDTTSWTDHAKRELFTNAPVYVDPTSALTATGVSNTVSGLSVVTHTNVQAALADLDAASAANAANTKLSQRQAAFRPTGATYETYPRASGVSVNPIVLPTSGKLMMQGIYLPAGLLVSNFSFLTGTTPATSPTHWWTGLYNSSRVQLAMSADQTSTAIGASSTFTLPVATVASGAASSFTTTYDGFYYVGLMVVASAMPNVYGITASLTSLAPITTGGSDTGQTTVPAFPHTATTITAGTTGLYVYLS